MLLGCIGDDFTGSSDIANTLAKGGMSVTQYNGVPDVDAASDVEAGVVSLKSRTEPVEQAVEESLKAARWLLDQGCDQLFFKYCSTFDSTPMGNIGPVADALAKLTGSSQVIFCPAFPATGRSVYQGNLFVNDVPLSESSLKDHPLTPMTDSDLRRWLSYQTDTLVKHLPFEVVDAGSDQITQSLNESGDGFYIADAITERNLRALGKAAQSHALLTGGSGLALGLPDNFRASGKLLTRSKSWEGQKGPGVVLSGSCSEATRNQIATYRRGNPSLSLTVDEIFSGKYTAESVAQWVQEQAGTPLIYSSAEPDRVARAQEKYGREQVAEKIENLFGELANKLADKGYSRIVSAGGETSGAVVQALGVEAMEIGPEIAPGVPALKVTGRPLTLALKSGNFGGEEFFNEALEVMAR